VVEHNLAKVGVESSNLFARSNFLHNPLNELRNSGLGLAVHNYVHKAFQRLAALNLIRKSSSTRPVYPSKIIMPKNVLSPISVAFSVT
jgi:hypothetical protein